MPEFDYVALDIRGRTKKGALAAGTEREARQELARRALTPVKIAPALGQKSRAGGGKMAAGRLSGKELTLVTRQLATLISVTPLEEALRTIASQADQKRVREVLFRVHGAVLEGFRLSDAMGREARSFPPLYRAMVAAGESSGALPGILERLADLQERQQEISGKVVSALVYPAMLSVTAILVVAALMGFVVPKIVEQFEGLGQSLPLLTRIVIVISNLVQQFGWMVLLALVIGGIIFARALRDEGFRTRFDRRVLTLPLIGKLLRDLNAALLSRTLATMVSSGLPLLEGLTIAARTVQNRVLRAAVENVAISIREGGSLSAAMRRTEVFPAILIYMAASGENSGRLDLMLERAAEYLEREFNTFTAVALSLLEPVIIVVMGLVVAAIVLAVLLPILQINTAVLR